MQFPIEMLLKRVWHPQSYERSGVGKDWRHDPERVAAAQAKRERKLKRNAR